MLLSKLEHRLRQKILLLRRGKVLRHQVHVFGPRSLFFKRAAGRLTLLFQTLLRFFHFLFPFIVQLLSDFLFDEVLAITFFLFTNLLKFVSAKVRFVIFIIICIVHDINV